MATSALTYGQRRPGEQGRPLEIAEKDVAEKVDFALPRMSVISGHVFDDLGEPIAGVTVWVLQTRYIQGRRQLVATGANATTDITGRYRLLSLPPGDYAVMGTTRETWPHDSDPKQVFGYASTYFPGTSTAAQAQRVKLGVAQEASGIDFSLVAGRVSTVRGTATSVSGVPLRGETVSMMREIGGPTMWMGSRWRWPRRRLPAMAAGRFQMFRPESTASRYGRRRAATNQRRKGRSPSALRAQTSRVCRSSRARAGRSAAR